MSWLLVLASRIRGLFSKRRLERELDEELRAHIEMATEENVRRGISAQEARRAVRRAFGGMEQTKEVYRERRGLTFVDTFLQDVKYGFRMLCHSPGVTAVAVLSLALGIGANSAIFIIMNAVMLRDLPVERPQELLEVTMGKGDDYFTNPSWEQLRDHQEVFSGVFAWAGKRFNLASGGEVRYSQSIMTSGDFFRTLGVSAILGRTYTAADDQRGCSALAVLSYDFWQNHYSGDGAVVGKKVLLDGHPFEIMGVVQPGFYGVEIGRRFDIATPICAEAVLSGTDNLLNDRSGWWLRVMGRRKPSLSLTQVTAGLKVLIGQIVQAPPPDANPDEQERYRHSTLETTPAANGIGYLRTQYQRVLITLMVAVGVVLLIACANVAGLLLARASVRQKEIAIRLAIGAPRSRLIRQLLTESILLSFIGAALGTLVAKWVSAVLVTHISSHRNPVFLDLTADLRLLSFTAAVAIGTGILFGIAPALRVTRIPLNAAMKGDARGSTAGWVRLGLGQALVVSQVALSLVLLIGAGLLVASFWKLMTVEAGFRRDDVLLVEVDPGTAQIPRERVSALYDQILERVRVIPGVRSASRSLITPISGDSYRHHLHADSGRPQSTKDSLIYLNHVSPGFFETLGTPLLAGRDFSIYDTKDSMPVAVINETTAKQYFRGMNPIGKSLPRFEEESTTIQIVGIVKDAKYRSLREVIPPTAYLPASQDKEPRVSSAFEIRTAVPASALISAVNSAFEGVNRELNLDFHTLAIQVNESLNRERLLASLSGFFGLLATLLTVIGLYGLMSYSVTHRTNEIGVRMALGATRSDILQLVMGEALWLTGSGVAVGASATFGVGRLVESQLYGIKTSDPGVMVAAIAVIAGVSILAGYLPARRATRVDPMRALRYE